MEQPYTLKQELNLLDPKRLRLYLDEFEELTVELDGVPRPVTALRAFPLTAADQFVILRHSDGSELGAIRNTSDLNPDSRRVLAAELERNYFTPRIVQVNAIEVNYHVPKWDVQTDRGPRIFEIRSTRRDILTLSGGRILIRDADGNRYEIPDYHRLDPVSQGLIETQI